MPIEFTKKKISLQGCCSVEEAEGVFDWLQKHGHGTLHLEGLTHLHAAVLQTLMTSHSTVKVWPTDEFSAECLRQALLSIHSNK